MLFFISTKVVILMQTVSRTVKKSPKEALKSTVQKTVKKQVGGSRSRIGGIRGGSIYKKTETEWSCQSPNNLLENNRY